MFKICKINILIYHIHVSDDSCSVNTNVAVDLLLLPILGHTVHHPNHIFNFGGLSFMPDSLPDVTLSFVSLLGTDTESDWVVNKL